MTSFTDLPDLASERLGGAVIAASDEFFAPKEALLKPHPPEWREEEYTERGKWMDGWETRRHSDGEDWCIVRLGAPGIVRGLVVDTAYFRGNYPDACSAEVCALPAPASPEALEAAAWVEILPRTPLQGDTPNLIAVDAEAHATHLRLRIFPDGGVARLRVHGEVAPAWTRFARAGGEVDLAALENGARVVASSDMFYGNAENMILPGRSVKMRDGWETRRRRGPGHDWAVVRLAAPGAIHRVEIDTDLFRGNAPERCSLEAVHLPGASAEALAGAAWTPLLPPTPLLPHARHRFEELTSAAPATHVRIAIDPCGGIARLRLFGTLSEGAR